MFHQQVYKLLWLQFSQKFLLEKKVGSVLVLKILKISGKAELLNYNVIQASRDAIANFFAPDNLDKIPHA